MRPDIHGSAKSRVILSGGVGYHPKAEGERRRKVIRGNTLSSESKFINLTIVGQPKGKKKAEKKEKTEETAIDTPAEEKRV
jgi:small subunit ribosomal protein S6e